MATNDRRPSPPRLRGTAPGIESLSRELEGLGLSPYTARILAALLDVGTANSIQLANLSGVPRTSTYQVMEGLTDQGLAERLAARGPARWTCHGWEAVAQVLDAAAHERLRQYQAQLHQVSRTLQAIHATETKPAGD